MVIVVEIAPSAKMECDEMGRPILSRNNYMHYRHEVWVMNVPLARSFTLTQQFRLADIQLSRSKWCIHQLACTTTCDDGVVGSLQSD